MQTLDVGELATIQTDWFDGNGDAAEPSAITLTIHPPSGADIVRTKPNMTGSESGSQPGVTDRWSYNQIATLAGLWRYDVEGVVDSNDVELPSGLFLVSEGTRAGPCEPWATWDEVEGCVSGAALESFQSLDSAQRESALDQASGVLYDLTGRVYTGLCQTTRSLCLSHLVCLGCGTSWGWPWPSGGCGRCEPLPMRGVDLGTGQPVWGAWDVIVDGTTLDPSAYTVVDRRYLVRVDGDPWPLTTDFADANTFRASWAFGRAVPAPLRAAAASFAAEIGKACAGQACQIPQRVTTIQREGITYTILDSLKMIQEGRTGIPLVDLAVVADRIGRRPRPRMFIPGLAGVRKVRP